MKTYRTVDPDWELPEDERFKVENTVEKIWTELDILKAYGPYWFKGMIEREKPIEVITAQNCIDDWVAVNWAEEL